MKKFEYKITTAKAESFYKENAKAKMENQFSLWGEEGWEMFKMEPIANGGHLTYGASTKSFVIVFKREKGE